MCAAPNFRAGVAAAAVTLLGTAALTAIWLRRRFVAVTVSGSSMTPTFQSGDRILVRRVALSEIRGGQVVVLAAPRGPAPPDVQRAGPSLAERGWIIKRVAAVQGEPVPAELAAQLRAAPGAAVPAGRLLVLGDNLNASLDSRALGYISGEDLLGVAVRRLGQPTRTRRV